VRLAVIGAGPIGLAAALGAARRGHDVVVLERGEVGDALLRWGPTRLFTPLGMNLPAWARQEVPGLPSGEALLTGPEMAREVLQPMAAAARLEGRVRTGHRVVKVARAGLTRTEMPGHPLRAERPFLLLIEGPDGEFTLEADAVIDASGVYGSPAWAGPGGLPAIGEREAGARVLRHLGALHAALPSLRGTRVLLAGHGHSAANAVLVLAGMAAEAPATRVTWAVRCAHARPVAEVAEDPLPERRRVAAAANALAQSPPAFLTMSRRSTIASLRARLQGFEVSFTGRGAVETFDHVAAFTGYRPDGDPVSELALEISAVTEGSARLARALSGVTDCLSVPRVRPEDLASGEPGFFLAGARSYGRMRTFLLRDGLRHVEAMLESLG
jgi:thioredoxin reductase